MVSTTAVLNNSQLTSMVLFHGMLVVNDSSKDAISDLMLPNLVLVNICMFLDFLALMLAFKSVSVSWTNSAMCYQTWVCG